MADINDPVPLPPGWDCKYDTRTGRFYFINYYTKSTTWDDPRLRHRPLQNHGTPVHHGSISEYIPLQDVTASMKMSPLASKGTPNRIQDTSLTTVADTEQLVTKIGAMFPTVTDTHIRILLKKYMKTIFPSVDETLLLDILCNNDNNVQKAAEVLISMGFEKREVKPPKLTSRKSEEEKVAEEAQKKTQTPTPPRVKTAEEKNQMKIKLQAEYKNIPEQVINIALESVNFNEDRANQILQIMVQEDSKPRTAVEVAESQPSTSEERDVIDEPVKADPIPEPVQNATEPSPVKTVTKEAEKETGKAWRNKNKKETPKQSHETTGVEVQNGEYRSSYLLKAVGPNRDLLKGPNDDILLPDYVTWSGANPTLTIGKTTSLAKGPNKMLVQQRTYQVKGPNSDICKGPLFGLAKGSIYSQLKAVLADTRGK